MELTDKDIGRRWKIEGFNPDIIWQLHKVHNTCGGMWCKYEFRDINDYDCEYCAWLADDKDLDRLLQEFENPNKPILNEQLTLF